jgi:hypothetical protein
MVLMTFSAIYRRKLYMHSAHRTIGVSGGGVALRPYCQGGDFSTPEDRLLAEPLLAVLSADRREMDSRASLTSFEQVFLGHNEIQCRRLEPDAIALEPGEADEADCVVMFRRGISIAHRWSDLDVACPSSEDCGEQDFSGLCLRIEVAAEARCHPLLKGIEPFQSHLSIHPGELVPDDARVLLVGRTAHAVHPMAWLEPNGHEDVFRTILGSPGDFECPDFVRLILASLRWVGQ